MNITIGMANDSHLNFSSKICTMIEEASKIRGLELLSENQNILERKSQEGKAIIAVSEDKVVGFCYIESWEGQKFVANSGLIIHPDFRKTGLARKIKSAILDLSIKKFPNAKLFGITTSLAVMKINSDLGYKPVTFNELTTDETFWKGCENCVNHDILLRTKRSMCLCTAMVCDPAMLPKNNKHVHQKDFGKILKVLWSSESSEFKRKQKSIQF